MVRSMDRTGAREQAGAVPGRKAARGRGRKWLLLLAPVALVLVAGGAVWALGGPTGDEEQTDEAEEVAEIGRVVELSDLTASVGGESFHYARLSMAAVLREGSDVAAVEERFPMLKDAALTELSRMDPTVLRSTAGLDRLRELMTSHAQAAYPEGEVLRILITELVVQ